MLAGCNNTTYGTGVTPGAQTLQDLAGIGIGAGPKKEPISYEARAPVVAPPVSGQLPPPQDESQTIAAANWPNDPDELARRRAAARNQRTASLAEDDDYLPLNSKDPNFRLPAGASAPPPPRSDLSPAERARGSRDEDERAAAARSAVNGNVAFDADGKPVRRYLTEPPAEYRLPDPDAPPPEAIEDCKPKWRWPWQRREPGERC